jgi:multicomponent Na+:H+ antiporter subunit D
VPSLAPLTVVIPLLAAASLVGAVAIAPRLFIDTLSIAVAAAVAVLAASLLHASGSDTLVYWFGGWEPRDGVAIGVSFAIDPLGAGLATFIAVLFVVAFVFAYRYFRVVGPLFHVLMLVFLAGAMGFCLTGDLFNLFVFLELVSVSAYALTAYDIEEEGPLTGTLNFAVTNSVGAALVLIGIALLYARTGALNLAQIGDALAGRAPDGLVIGAFTFLTVGFFTKAAVVPFHFWLADAYSVAPTPVCLLLSAAMSELGLYAFARVYWTVFAGTLGGAEEAITLLLLAAGAVTAVVGAVMCFSQRHLKRMLAFATVSHVGLYLLGIALLDPEGLAGAAVYVIADGAVKASLFVGVGVIQHRYGTVDELALRGRGRDLRPTGVLITIGGLALASLPGFGPFLGKSIIEESASTAGHGWVAVVLVVCSALTGGAVLRSAARIFLGWGDPDEPPDDFSMPGKEVDPEEQYPHDRVPLPMTVTAVALLAGGLLIGLAPGLPADAIAAATRFTDRPAYVATVLHGHAAPVTTATFDGPAPRDWLFATLSTLGAIALAVRSLWRGRIRDTLRGPPGHMLRAALVALRALHSGHVGDYVTWVVVGTVIFGGIWAATLG